MIVSNFYRMIVAASVMSGSAAVLQLANGEKLTVSGLTYYVQSMRKTLNIRDPLENTTATGSFLAFGAGDDPVKSDDYMLSKLVTDYEVINTQSTINIETTDTFYTMTRIIQNNGTDDLTIKEVGLFTAYNQKTWLLARQVLDTPVTLKPGDKRAFVMALSA